MFLPPHADDDEENYIICKILSHSILVETYSNSHLIIVATPWSEEGKAFSVAPTLSRNGRHH